MRILVLGAGALGGYFGGRLVQAGVDTTFIVRPGRRGQIAKDGLVVKSTAGDFALPPAQVKTVLQAEVKPGYDAVFFTCKAYDLDSAMDAIAPGMGPDTLILPVLNGMAHLDALDARFGASRVLGGVARIGATMTAEGEIRHSSPFHDVAFGRRDGSQDAAVQALAAAFAKAAFTSKLHPGIAQEMWDKWVMLGTLASMTCLMRANVGQYMAADEGEALAREMAEEARSIAAACGHGPGEGPMKGVLSLVTAKGSAFTASMQRDLAAGGRVEADHIVGDLLKRGREKGVNAPLMRVAYAHLQTYQRQLKA